MTSASEFAAAWEGIRNSYEAGRLAHAYTVVGAPRGTARTFAESVLKLLFCTAAEKPCNTCSACRRIDDHVHPDVFWLEPLSKGRNILVGEMRELITRMQQTSYEGGWKAGVILYADCLTAEAANAFLKTLEEPSGQSLLLLLTDRPDQLLPTVRSRCQRIVLSDVDTALDGDLEERVRELLIEGQGTGPVDAFVRSDRLKDLLEEVKERALADAEADADDDVEMTEKVKKMREARAQARMLEVRAQVLNRMLMWQRDILYVTLGAEESLLHFADEKDNLRRQAEGITPDTAMRRIRELEELIRRLDRNIPVTAAADLAFLAG